MYPMESMSASTGCKKRAEEYIKSVDLTDKVLTLPSMLSGVSSNA